MDSQKLNEKLPTNGQIWDTHLGRHRHLQDLARDLKHTLRIRDRDLIYSSARRFSFEVSKHIKEEEAPDGIYMYLKGNPKCAAALKRLQAQHEEILVTLKEVCSEVDENLPAVILYIDDCIALVVQHEKEEEQLFEKILEGKP